MRMDSIDSERLSWWLGAEIKKESPLHTTEIYLEMVMKNIAERNDIII